MRGDADQARAQEARVTPAPAEGEAAQAKPGAPAWAAGSELPHVPATTEPPDDGPGQASSPGVRVLVVDDDPDARELLTVLLEACGMLVRTAASARAALDALCEEPPDVLVSDIGMPEEDGYSLIRKIRALQDDEQRAVPAIALTAFARTEDRQRALRAGFDRHLAKPVEPSALTAIIADLARARSGQHG